jgi:hypothetical protein
MLLLQIAATIFIGCFVLGLLRWIYAYIEALRDSNRRYANSKKEAAEFEADYDAYYATLTPERQREVDRAFDYAITTSDHKREIVIQAINSWKYWRVRCTYCTAGVNLGDKFCTKCGRAKISLEQYLEEKKTQSISGGAHANEKGT